MSNDENETLDFGQGGLFDNLPGDDDATASVPEDDAALAAEAADESQEDEDKEEKPGLLERITSASPYTVLLGASLVAILIACFCLGMELAAYGWDVGAKAFHSS